MSQTISKPKVFSLHLCGVFRILDEAGKDCTPRGVKTCALLALLACSGSLTSSRARLQDTLWSDRDQEHGAASLRQCLSEIRRVFGSSREALVSNRRSVGLQDAYIKIVDDPSEGEFLEGMDVRDAEFEDWLALERSRRAAQGSMAKPSVHAAPVHANERPALRVHIHRSDVDMSSLQVVEDFVLDNVGRTLRELLLADVTCFERGSTIKSDQACDVRVKLRAFSLGERMVGLRVSAEDGRSGALVWSDTQQTFLRGVLPSDSVELLRICNEMLDALSYHFAIKAQQSPERAGSGMLVHLALRHLFTMTREGSEEADKLLADAAEYDDRNGLIFATRAHVRAIQWAEQYGMDEENLRAEAQHFFHAALELEPTNAAVLANLANTTLILDKNLSLSEELASRAIALNPSNPFAWWVKSGSELYMQRFDDAHQSALRASALLGPGPLKFWWDFKKGLATAISGTVDDAIRELSRAHATAPTFRPALRVLLALHAATDNDDAIAKIVAKLRELEPDFDTRRFVEDVDYPSKLLRSEPFMTERSKALLLDH